MIWIFREMTSGIIFRCSALGSTVDTCMASVYEVMAVSHIFFVNVNSDPEGTLSLSTETGLHSANCAADREDLTGTVLGFAVMRPLLCSDRCRGSDSTEFRGDSAVTVRCCGSSTRSSLSEGGFAAFCGIFRTPSAWT